MTGYGYEVHLQPKSDRNIVWVGGRIEEFTKQPWWMTQILVAGIVLYGVDSLYNLLGILLWFPLEYLFHRFALHWPDRLLYIEGNTGKILRTAHYMLHGHHHAYPNDLLRVSDSPVVVLLLYNMMRLVFGGYAVGIMIGYAWYDYTHYCIHAKRGFIGYMQRKHLAHHYINHNSYYMVSI